MWKKNEFVAQKQYYWKFIQKIVIKMGKFYKHFTVNGKKS